MEDQDDDKAENMEQKAKSAGADGLECEQFVRACRRVVCRLLTCSML